MIQHQDDIKWNFRFELGGVKTIIAAIIVLATSFIGVGIFNVQSVYCNTDGTIYHEYKEGYKIKKPGNGADVIILSEINGKAVTDASYFATPNTKTITFVGGEWTIDYLTKHCWTYISEDAEKLETITIEGANITVETESMSAFSFCRMLKEVYVNNGTLRVNLSPNSATRYDGSWDIFANPKLSIYLNNGSLINLPDDLALLDISGESNVDVALRVPKKSWKNGSGTPWLCIDSVVFHDGADLSGATYKRNTLTYDTLEDRYYPISNEIYLPATISEIPDYFFGDVMEQDVEQIKVYFAGTKEEWENITVGNKGNENFFSDRVNVECNYKSHSTKS